MDMLAQAQPDALALRCSKLLQATFPGRGPRQAQECIYQKGSALGCLERGQLLQEPTGLAGASLQSRACSAWAGAGFRVAWPREAQPELKAAAPALAVEAAAGGRRPCRRLPPAQPPAARGCCRHQTGQPDCRQPRLA